MKRVVFLLLFLAACAQPAPVVEERVPRGFYLSPVSMEEDHFSGFMELSKDVELLGWAGDWLELEDESAAPHVITKLAPQYGYEPVIVAQFFTQKSGALLRPLNQENRDRYKAAAVSFAQTYQPEYLGLGIEVNELYDNADVDAFAAFFPIVYDAVKAVSPDTKVFTSFQLERMRGGGGLFGEKNKPQWDLLDRFAKSDLAVFTTYPATIYARPSDIPNGYYSDILQHTSKPIAFAEVAWHTGKLQGWEGSEQEQVDFVNAFWLLTSTVDPEFALWTHVYDQEYDAPFNSLGLRNKDGSARPAWDAWT